MTDVKDLGPLTYNVPITDGSGRPSPEFQRRWNTQRNNNDLIIAVTGTPATGELVKFSGPKSVTNGDLSGDITTSGTLVTTLKTVNANVGSFGDGLHVATFTVNAKGLTTAAASVAIPNFTSSTAGLAPASGGGTTNFLRADGTWAIAGTGTVTHTTGTLTSGQLVVGNGSADIKVGDLSGDVSTSGSGVTTIGALKVATGMIQVSAVTEAKIGLSNVTTNNVTTSAHGFAPILPNDATKYLDGTGAYSIPGGSSSGALLAVQRFSTHQTTTPTFNASTNSIIIILVGAGGGGRSVAAPSAGNVSVGNPGGGGAVLVKRITGRTNFVSKQLVVGTAGVGGAAAGAPNSGTNGGDTTFDAAGANYKAGGGFGGTSAGIATPGWIVATNNQGTASNGDANFAGNFQLLFTTTNLGGTNCAYCLGGSPADPKYGVPGICQSILAIAAVQGGDATGNGAGGSGGITYPGNTPLRGGNGSDGYAEIWEYT